MKCLYRGGTGEIEEKKSRFIANTAPVSTEDEAAEFIASIKKQHYSAKHNCYAYILDNGNLMRSSDDGEPGGTAGRPILEVLKNEGLTDTVIVVTRYFGGTLLGTGGLIRAYTESAKAGLDNSVIIDKLDGILFTAECDYSYVGKLQHIFSSENINVVSDEYAENVIFTLVAESEKFEGIKKHLIDITNAKIEIKKEKSCRFADICGSIMIFD